MIYATKNNDWKITSKNVTCYIAFMDDWTIRYWISTEESLIPGYLINSSKWDKASLKDIHKLMKLIFDVDEIVKGTKND